MVQELVRLYEGKCCKRIKVLKRAKDNFMAMEIVTKEDLQAFRRELLFDFRAILKEEITVRKEGHLQGYKTKDVRNILGCSVNKLVSLRVSRKVRWKKVGGTVYYNREDIRRLVEEGF